ncbi:uncharacterized protein DMAD_05666 [Drosophila madeirensis]|uniref:Uncharacterized protein n=1 Tax=Drosophila madeirensis TaxID=30013 RepID=A0AAU9FNJ4_DROMD
MVQRSYSHSCGLCNRISEDPLRKVQIPSALRLPQRQQQCQCQYQSYLYAQPSLYPQLPLPPTLPLPLTEDPLFMVCALRLRV